MTSAVERTVRRNLRGLRRRSVGPAVLLRPHGLSTGAGVPVRVLEVAAPVEAGAVSLSLRAPDGARLRGEAQAGLVVEITAPDGASVAATPGDESPGYTQTEKPHQWGSEPLSRLEPALASSSTGVDPRVVDPRVAGIVRHRTTADATASDDFLTLTFEEPLAVSLAEGEPVTLHPAEHVFPHAAPRAILHDRLPETLIGQVEAEYVLPALPGLPRPRPGDRLRFGEIEGTVLAVPSALGGIYVVQIGGGS